MIFMYHHIGVSAERALVVIDDLCIKSALRRSDRLYNRIYTDISDRKSVV